MRPMRLLLLPGDGIGPEIAAVARAAVEAAARAEGLGLVIDSAEIGLPALARTGTTLPPGVLRAARAADGVILGPVSHNDYPPEAEGGVNPSGALRRALELYANLRPARTPPGMTGATGRPLDLVVVRENLEGFYADRNMTAGPGEVSPEPGLVLSLRKITRRGSRRIAARAFALAARRPDGRVTAVHKANVLRMGDGLFLECCRAAARAHPGVAYDECLVDAAAAHLVRDPGRFDVIVTTNMFGDILSDLASELAGGLGLAASLNVGPRHAAAQAQHGSAPDIAGRDIANPVSLVLSAAMLLQHLGADGAADRISAAVDALLARPECRTPDLGGPLGTAAFGTALVQRIDRP